MAKASRRSEGSLLKLACAGILGLFASALPASASSVIYQQNFNNLAGGPTSGTPYVAANSISSLVTLTNGGIWTFNTRSWSGVNSNNQLGGSIASPSEGLLEITRNFDGSGLDGPNPGVLILHDAVSNNVFSLNEAILTVNLAGYTDIALSFREYDSNDEEHLLSTSGTPQADRYTDSSLLVSNGPRFDGVSISSNGTDWFLLYNPTNHNGNWKTIGKAGVGDAGGFVIPTISAFISSVGSPLLTASSSLHIKFSQYDNAYHGTDGRKYENILLTGILGGGVGGSAPEPATFVLFGLGAAGLASSSLRRRLLGKRAAKSV